MHKIQRKSAPSMPLSKFRKPSHSYSTQFSHLNYVKPIPNLKKCKYGIFYTGPFTWNNFLSTKDKQFTHIAKSKAVTKSKWLSLENEVIFFWYQIFVLLHIRSLRQDLNNGLLQTRSLNSRQVLVMHKPLSSFKCCFFSLLHLTFLLKHNLLLYFASKGKKTNLKTGMFQENKARQIFWKTNISDPWYAQKCLFFRKFGVLCFLETYPFWDSLFCLNTDELVVVAVMLWIKF